MCFAVEGRCACARCNGRRLWQPSLAINVFRYKKSYTTVIRYSVFCHNRHPLHRAAHAASAALSGLAGGIDCVRLSGFAGGGHRLRWAVELRAGCVDCAGLSGFAGCVDRAALSGLAGALVVVARRACRSLSAALVGSAALAAVRRRLQPPARGAGRCLHRAPLTPCRFVAFGPAAFLMLGESVIMALEKAAGWKAAFAWHGSSVTRCWRVARETSHLGSPARPRLRRPSAADAQRSRDPMRPTP